MAQDARKIATEPLEQDIAMYEELLKQDVGVGELGHELSIAVGSSDVVAFGGDVEGPALWVARFIREEEWPPSDG